MGSLVVIMASYSNLTVLIICSMLTGLLIDTQNMPQRNYLIARTAISPQQSETLEKWIINHKFEEYESSEYGLDYKVGRRCNNVYKFMLSDINQPVAMKVTPMLERYEWNRRFELILKHYLRDANLKAFRCCLRAYPRNLAAPKPLAYWQKRDSLTEVKSYFLYQYTEASFPWLKLYEALGKVKDEDSELKRDLIRRKIINALKYLHKAGIRHGDIVPHNIIMSVQNSEHLADAKVYFIDYDGGTRTKIKHPAFIKRLFDLKDLQKGKLEETLSYDMLKLYLEDDYHPLWRVVFNFFQRHNPHVLPENIQGENK